MRYPGHGLGQVTVPGFAEILDPRPYAVGQIAEAYATYPHIGNVLPALGYAEADVADLQRTIERVPCDTVLVATPVDLSRISRYERGELRIHAELLTGVDLGRPLRWLGGSPDLRLHGRVD